MSLDDRSPAIALAAKNGGAETVTLLSLRVTLLDERGDPVASWNEWAATPIAADGDWPGPILPGSTRSLSVRARHLPRAIPAEKLRVEAEISDVRVWGGEGAAAEKRV